MAVPFETLDISLGRPIRLDLGSLLSKVVEARRGGYCYELNGLFAALLRHLGYAVDLVSARVDDLGRRDSPTPSTTWPSSSPRPCSTDRCWPMSASVTASSSRCRCAHGAVAHERGKDVGLVREGDDWHYRERADGGEWRTQFVFTTTPHPLADFEPRNVWQQTSPESHFTRGPVVSRLTPTGRVTLRGTRLITTTPGRRDEVVLDEADVPAALAGHFGIVIS